MVLMLRHAGEWVNRQPEWFQVDISALFSPFAAESTFHDSGPSFVGGREFSTAGYHVHQAPCLLQTACQRVFFLIWDLCKFFSIIFGKYYNGKLK